MLDSPYVGSKLPVINLVLPRCLGYVAGINLIKIRRDSVVKIRAACGQASQDETLASSDVAALPSDQGFPGSVV